MFGLLHARFAEPALPQVALRTARRLDQVDTAGLLDRIAALRDEVGRVRGQVGRETVPDASLGALASALDHTARLITGEMTESRPVRSGSAILVRRCA